MYLNIKQGNLGGTDYDIKKNKLKEIAVGLGLEFEEFDYAGEVACKEDAVGGLDIWLQNNGFEFIDENYIETVEGSIARSLFYKSSLDEEGIEETVSESMKEYMHLLKKTE